MPTWGLTYGILQNKRVFLATTGKKNKERQKNCKLPYHFLTFPRDLLYGMGVDDGGVGTGIAFLHAAYGCPSNSGIVFVRLWA
jgi:hypothetical protein